MKTNNKNRKLSYIRYKNKLRIGRESFGAYLRFQNDLDESVLKLAIEKLCKNLVDEVWKKYRIILRNCDLFIGHNYDDIIYDRQTARITLHNRP